MIVFTIIGVVVVVFIIFDWMRSQNAKSTRNSDNYPVMSQPVYTPPLSIKPPFMEQNETSNISLIELVEKAKKTKQRIRISNLAPYIFKQAGDEKMSTDPQVIELDFAKQEANLSAGISIVVATDSTLLINSYEKFNDAYVINLSPQKYDFIIAASIMYSNDKIVVIDTELGMFVRFESNQDWVIKVSDSDKEAEKVPPISEALRRKIMNSMNNLNKE